MALFNEDERKKIAQAIASVEESTSGELVVLHTHRSDDYALIRGGFGFFGSLGLIDLIHFLHPVWDLSWLLVSAAVLGSLLYLLAGWGPLLRLLVPVRMRADAALERAFRAMVQEGVTETRDRSGVLIFLSESEHRVVILADSGINSRVETEEWARDVETLVQALKAGRATEGVLSVVGRVGELLAASFPPRADDTNELSNEPRSLD